MMVRKALDTRAFRSLARPTWLATAAHINERNLA
jgi:hypothetical protein